MSLSDAKVQFGNREINNPLMKAIVVVFGLLLAAAIISLVVFFVLPIVGAVLGFVLIAVVAVALTVGALAIPVFRKVKNNSFEVKFSDEDRAYNISLDNSVEIKAKAIKSLEILLEIGTIKISESPTGEIICRSENGAIGYLEEGDNLYLKSLSKNEDQLEVLIPRNLDILAKVGKGELDLREVPVALKVQMGMGKIMAYSTVKDLSVESGNAKVFAHDLVGNADLKLGMGDIMLDVTPTGLEQDISIKSAKVNAKVVVPEGIPVNAKADGLKVTIDSELPMLDEAPLKINMAAALGNVEIKEKSNLIYLQ